MTTTSTPLVIGNLEDDNNKDPNIPVVAHTAIVPLPTQERTESLYLTESVNGDIESQKSFATRAEFISVSMLKTQSSDDGIIFEAEADGVLRIFDILETSDLIHSPICPGDEVIRINGTDCQHQGPAFASSLIRQSGDVVTIVVRSEEGGDPRVAWSHAVLPFNSLYESSPLGVSFAGSNGEILVRKVDPEGMFARSMLRVGDKILSINDNDCCDADVNHDVALLLLETAEEKSIKIVSKRVPSACRPHLISVTVRKESSEEDIGLEASYSSVDGKVRVKSLVPFGALCQSPILVGDEIASINKQGFDSSMMANDFLRQLGPGLVTVVVRVEDGDPSVVASMVVKPTPNTRIGMTVGERRRNTLVIREIEEDGLMAHSLLNVGDRLLYINDHDCAMMTPEEATVATSQADTTVKILVESNADHAVVVSTYRRPIFQSGSSIVETPIVIWDGVSTRARRSPRWTTALSLAMCLASLFIIFLLLRGYRI